MTAAKHTPGPWKSDSIGQVHAFEHGLVAKVVSERDEITIGQFEREANRCLIAAAPDLLAALQILLDTGADCTMFNYAQSKARAAIAKATGTA